VFWFWFVEIEVIVVEFIVWEREDFDLALMFDFDSPMEVLFCWFILFLSMFY
jgi:hypothetical protein